MSSWCLAVCILICDESQQSFAHKVSSDVRWHLHRHKLEGLLWQTDLAIYASCLAIYPPAGSSVFAGLSAKYQIACCQSAGFQRPASETAESCLESRKSAAIPSPLQQAIAATNANACLCYAGPSCRELTSWQTLEIVNPIKYPNNG